LCFVQSPDDLFCCKPFPFRLSAPLLLTFFARKDSNSKWPSFWGEDYGFSSKYSQKELDKKIRVCVPDRMFENWIVSDIEGIKSNVELIDQSATQQHYDGTSGATILKRIMQRNYRKTIHGPKLFYSTRFEISKDNSPSFQVFFNIIGS
jgi:hypothetical protein